MCWWGMGGEGKSAKPTKGWPKLSKFERLFITIVMHNLVWSLFKDQWEVAEIREREERGVAEACDTSERTWWQLDWRNAKEMKGGEGDNGYWKDKFRIRRWIRYENDEWALVKGPVIGREDTGRDPRNTERLRIIYQTLSVRSPRDMQRHDKKAMYLKMVSHSSHSTNVCYPEHILTSNHKPGCTLPFLTSFQHASSCLTFLRRDTISCDQAEGYVTIAVSNMFTISLLEVLERIWYGLLREKKRKSLHFYKSKGEKKPASIYEVNFEIIKPQQEPLQDDWQVAIWGTWSRVVRITSGFWKKCHGL